MSKENNQNRYSDVKKQEKKPELKAEVIPAKKQRKGWRSPNVAVVAELILAVVCAAAFVLLFTLRTCEWDLLLLVIWAVVLTGSAILLVRGERRLAAIRRNEGDME